VTCKQEVRYEKNRDVKNSVNRNIFACVFYSSHYHLLINRYVHGKNDFAKTSKNLARYKSENNFIRPLK